MKTIAFRNHVAAWLLFLLIFPVTHLGAQNLGDNGNFSNAFGARLGRTTGFTFKHKFVTGNAIELILGARRNVYSITGLYEFYEQTAVDGLGLYAGFGGHIGGAYYRHSHFYHTGNDQVIYYERRFGYGPIIGVDGIAGIEYKIQKTSLALSFDMKPMVEFHRDFGPYLYLDPGIGIKYTIK